MLSAPITNADWPRTAPRGVIVAGSYAEGQALKRDDPDLAGHRIVAATAGSLASVRGFYVGEVVVTASAYDVPGSAQVIEAVYAAQRRTPS